MAVGVTLGNPPLFGLDLCSILRSIAIWRPLACASALVGKTFDARWLPSTLFCHPS